MPHSPRLAAFGNLSFYLTSPSQRVWRCRSSNCKVRCNRSTTVSFCQL